MNNRLNHFVVFHTNFDAFAEVNKLNLCGWFRPFNFYGQRWPNTKDGDVREFIRSFESSHRRSTWPLGGTPLAAASFLKSEVRCYFNHRSSKT